MPWLEIAFIWIAASIAVPVLYGLRYNYVKNYRERAIRARARLHRFHFRQDFPITYH